MSIGGLGTGYSNVADIMKRYKESHKLAAKELKEDKDFRDMSVDEWDKMLEGVDKYIDAYKERLKKMKEMQEKAAQKAAMKASPDMRTIAASKAALHVAAYGFEGTLSSEDPSVGLEKNWTKNLATEDQIILRTAKAAQKMENMAMPKYQELMLLGDTTVGVERAEGVTECATASEDENNKKVWTITAFTAQGIVSKKYQDGKIISHWEMKYKNPEDAEKVWDFLARFDKDADLKFAGSKEFWENFLSEDADVEKLLDF